MKNGKRVMLKGCLFIAAFVVWTMLIRLVDVQQTGVNGTNVGFATFNTWFHKLTGVHMTIYVVTDLFAGNMKIGILFAIVFPMILLMCLVRSKKYILNK